jgi:hypothetical protein
MKPGPLFGWIIYEASVIPNLTTDNIGPYGQHEKEEFLSENGRYFTRTPVFMNNSHFFADFFDFFD